MTDSSGQHAPLHDDQIAGIHMLGLGALRDSVQSRPSASVASR